MRGGVPHQWSREKVRVRVTPTGPLENAWVCQACGTPRQIRSSAPSCHVEVEERDHGEGLKSTVFRRVG